MYKHQLINSESDISVYVILKLEARLKLTFAWGTLYKISAQVQAQKNLGILTPKNTLYNFMI